MNSNLPENPIKPLDDRPRVAIAILYQLQPDGSLQFLMQLRDNIPGIAYPGYWGFFGGHIEPGEAPEVAVKREILEEINYIPPAIQQFGVFEGVSSIRHVYQAPFTATLDALTLTEGWDMGLLTLKDVHRGDCYSTVAKEVRPLGESHRNILLDFIEQQSNILRTHSAL